MVTNSLSEVNCAPDGICKVEDSCVVWNILVTLNMMFHSCDCVASVCICMHLSISCSLWTLKEFAQYEPHESPIKAPRMLPKALSS